MSLQLQIFLVYTGFGVGYFILGPWVRNLILRRRHDKIRKEINDEIKDLFRKYNIDIDV